MPVHRMYSGVYAFGGGVREEDTTQFVDGHGRPLAISAERDPRSQPFTSALLNRASEARDGEIGDILAFTCHIDIDGEAPLDVVSGQVRIKTASDSVVKHFIGKVHAKTPDGNSITLNVRDFEMNLPLILHINALAIHLNLSGNRRMGQFTFANTLQNRMWGPFDAQRTSEFFRQVTLEVDREQDTQECEPYDTHAHPDHPADLPRTSLKLETAFEAAGIQLVRSIDHGNIITSSADGTWSKRELHDAMIDHWSAQSFAHPQWKCWFFIAKRGWTERLAGAMFDYNDGDFNGLERQGAAIFTEDPYYFDIQGPYPTSNPPAAAAVKRELFFTLVHEVGHLFNLTHSYEKTAAREWKAPTWMRVENRPVARSWMNYPERASALGGSTKPFYDEFRFRFDDQEHLFLRHAPGKFIEMGGENWGKNSARAFFDELDARLHLRLSALKPVYQLGEFPVLELRLKNIGAEPVLVDGNLDITGDAIEVVVLGPDGVRRAVFPVLVYWKAPSVQMLAPGASLYRTIDLAFSKGGQPISRPGWHRVEVVYTNCDGKKAVAYCRVFVAPPDHIDDWGVINELLASDVGRFLYFAGSRTMAETDQRLKWCIKKLGPHHPVATRLIVARALP